MVMDADVDGAEIYAGTHVRRADGKRAPPFRIFACMRLHNRTCRVPFVLRDKPGDLNDLLVAQAA